MRVDGKNVEGSICLLPRKYIDDIYAFYIELYGPSAVECNIFAIMPSLVSSDKPSGSSALLSRARRVCIKHEIDPRSTLRNENVAAMGARSVSSFAELSRNRR